MITPSFGLTATERVLPRLALDFTTASLDPRVSFTRALNTATRVNSSGYIETVNADLPRFDFDPSTLICKGLLIEEARTNLRNNSNLFNNWSAKSNVTISDGTQLSPDNSTNASSIFANSGFANAHVRLQISGLINGTVYAISVYVRANGSTGTRFWNLNLTGTNVYNDVRFNPVTGAAISGSTGFTSTPAANGYRRYVLTFTADSTNGAQFYFYPTNGVDNAQGVNAYGFQLEVGAFATSLIPTSGGTATRNADVATMTGTNFSDWFNATEGTFVATTNKTTTAITAIYLSANDGTNTNRMQLVWNSPTNSHSTEIIATTTQASLTTGAITSGINKASFAYKLNNIAASVNAATPLTDTVATIPTVTTLSIGSRTYLGNAFLNGWFTKLFYYPQRLTDAEVQAFSK